MRRTRGKEGGGRSGEREGGGFACAVPGRRTRKHGRGRLGAMGAGGPSPGGRADADASPRPPRSTPDIDNPPSFADWTDGAPSRRVDGLALLASAADEGPSPTHARVGRRASAESDSDSWQLRMSSSEDGSDAGERRHRGGVHEKHPLDLLARRVERALAAGSRGFATGAALRGGIGVLKLVLGTSRTKRAPTRRSAAAVLKDALRFGTFLGTFSGGYVAIDEALERRFGEDSKRWRHLVAGVAAGPSLLLAGGKDHGTLATYLLVRAAVLVVRAGLKPGRPQSKRLLTQLGATAKHGDVGLLCLTAAHILSSYMFWPGSFDPGYRAFLDSHGGPAGVLVREPYVAIVRGSDSSASVEAVKRATQAAAAKVAAIGGARAGRVVARQGDPSMGPPLTRAARLLNPWQHSVGKYFAVAFAGEFKRALSMYAPLYLATSAIVQRGRWLQSPRELLFKNAVGVGRSSAFLASYVATAWTGLFVANALGGMVLPRGLQRGLPAVFLLTSTVSLGGLSAFVEAKSRRMELALFCASRVLHSVYGQVLGRLGRTWSARLRVDIFLFSVSMGVLTHCYERERDIFRSKYLNVLDFIFGPPTSSGLRPSASQVFQILEGQGLYYIPEMDKKWRQPESRGGGEEPVVGR